MLVCGVSAPVGHPGTCANSAECMSGYCISSSCSYPIFQVSELEFWRSGQKIETQKVNDTEFDAYRAPRRELVIDVVSASQKMSACGIL